MESLEDIKFSAEDIYLEMQKLKPKIKEIEQNMENAENESLFGLNYIRWKLCK